MSSMRAFALLSLTSAAVLSHARLVAWIPLDGNTQEVMRGSIGQLVGESRMGGADGLKSVDFSGKNGAVFFKDDAQFVLSSSFSISATVFVRENPRGGTSPAGQIVFRGDDRCGLDNYSLNLGNDGYYTFNFYSDSNDCGGVRAPAAKGKWQTLLGTFDAETKVIRLIIDGVLVAESSVPLIPVTTMEANWAPGLSIGNVQNPLGGNHNQPFNGWIRDVRLYDNAIFWDELRKTPLRNGGASGKR